MGSKIENGRMTKKEGRLYHKVTICIGKMSLLAGYDNKDIEKLENYLPAEAAYLDHVEKYGKTKYTERIKCSMITARDVSELKLEDKLG